MKKLSLLILLTMTLGCTTVIRADQTGATSEGVLSVVESNDKFAIDFYNNIREGESGNIFFSPYSLSTALGMTYEGTGGVTREEIKQVFYFMENDSLRRSSTGAVYNLINTPRAKYQLSTANALWVQKDFLIKEDYLGHVKKYYMGEAINLDFIKNPEESRIIINDWVEGHTNNKIIDLLPLGVISSLTRLVLTNAIHFKGDWLMQFDESKTKDEEFNNRGEIINVSMMRLDEGEPKFNYIEDNDAQVLELVYEGEELSMLIILPKNTTLDVIEDQLTIEKLRGWRDNLRERTVNVYLPKFTFETKYYLKENLMAMGLLTAFSDNADFSGMSDISLAIDEVIHQAFIEVNEEGTEAAAATAVVMKLNSLPMVDTFRADHPFIFIIQERTTGSIVFMGRVVDPR